MSHPADRTEIQLLEEEVQQLRHALAHRPQTDRVVGMLMLIGSCGPDAAWAALARASQDANVKVRDLALTITTQVATGSGLPPQVSAALRRQLLLTPRSPSTKQKPSPHKKPSLGRSV